MPIYEYECPNCGKVFEKWAKSADAHKAEPCPDCGTESPRVISRTSFVLKGNGWYVSDYGYRKGISEDSGGKADVPLPATPTKPAKQGEKAVAKIPEKKSAEPTAQESPKPTGSPKAAEKKPDVTKTASADTKPAN